MNQKTAKKYRKEGLVLLSLLFLLTGCSLKEKADPGLPESPAETGVEENEGSASTDETETLTEASGLLVEYSTKDLETTYDAESATSIVFSDTVEITGEGAAAEGGTVTITKEGTYVLSGESEDGSVSVNVTKEEDVILILNGLNLTSKSTSALKVYEADKVILTLASGTKNVLKDGETYTEEDLAPDGTIYSKGDLTINGEGELVVYGSYAHGIVSKDDLKIVSGEVTVYAKEDGIKGKDMVAVKEGSLFIEAGADGIQASNDEDAAKGFVLLENGSFTIEAGNDGIQAETVLEIRQGTYTITTGGGSSISSTSETWGSWGPATGTVETSDSAKGLKAGTALYMLGGEVDLNSSDDAVHSNGSILIKSGLLSISSGDDGIHGDDTVEIAGGEIYIEMSYEGIEGAKVIIGDGKIHVGAKDDGINTAGGNDGSSLNGRPGQNMFASDGSFLSITGGEITISAEGDGIDVNGDGEMSGGTVLVEGPVNDGNSALDYNGTFTVTGGTLLAVGSSGMAMNISESSTQGAFLLNGQSVAAGKEILIETSGGEALYSFTPKKNLSSILFTSDRLKNGETYRVLAGGEELSTVEMTSLVTTVGGGGMNPGGGMFPGGNTMPGGGKVPGKRP